jgi:hypothetical protein
MGKRGPSPMGARELLNRHTVMRGLFDCWVWSGRRDAWGYGKVRLRIDGRRVEKQAHRLMYEAWVGHIPPGLVIRHTCDNRICMNPSHMELGTHADNYRDMVERGRVRHGKRLSTERQAEIRARWLRGETRRSICESMGHTPQTVRRVLRGVTR